MIRYLMSKAKERISSISNGLVYIWSSSKVVVILDDESCENNFSFQVYL